MLRRHSSPDLSKHFPVLEELRAGSADAEVPSLESSQPQKAGGMSTQTIEERISRKSVMMVCFKMHHLSRLTVSSNKISRV